MSIGHRLAVVTLLSLVAGIARGSEDDNPPDEIRPAAVVTGDVSSSGAFSTSLAIRVPSARGPAPGLALVYSSMTRNGIAGVGWSLAGLPAIARIRGENGMAFNGSDLFAYLPGGIETTAGADDVLAGAGAGNYHLSRVQAGAPLARFQPGGTCGVGPCYWKMTDGSGTTYYFGGDASSPANVSAALYEPNNGDTSLQGIVVYALYKVVDADGNYLIVSYENDSRTLRPSRIEYNLPLAGPYPRSMLVTFEYSARPDPTPMPYSTSVRLSNIRVYGNVANGQASPSTLVRRYQLDYTLSGARQSLLQAFKEYGSNGDLTGAQPLEPTTFTYAPAAQKFSGTVKKLAAQYYTHDCNPNVDRRRCRYESFLGDLDGDGRADIVHAYYGQAGAFVAYRCGQGGTTVGSSAFGPVVEHTNASGAQAETLLALADVDGDGRQDLIASSIFTTAIGTQVARGVRNADGTCGLAPFGVSTGTTYAAAHSSAYEDWRIAPADLDGDGSADLVLLDALNRVFYRHMSRAGSFSATAAGRRAAGIDWTACMTAPGEHAFSGLSTADRNGDGKADVTGVWARRGYTALPVVGQIVEASALGLASDAGLGPVTESCQVPSSAFSAPAPRYPYMTLRDADINGDGRSDLTLTYQGYTNTGAGVVHGRDMRTMLGTTRTSARSWRASDTDTASYPGHLGFNRWDFHFADTSGDGIDDVIQSYKGVQGDRLYTRLSTPPGNYLPFSAIYNDQVTQYPDAPTVEYAQVWQSVSGDFNGDGLQDVARGMILAGQPDRRELKIFLGSSSGLATTPVDVPLGGAYLSDASIQLLAGDVNADGRDDLVFASRGSRAAVFTNYETGELYAGVVLSMPDTLLVSWDGPVVSPAPLLETIDDGKGGTMLVRYAPPRDFASAVLPGSTTCRLAVPPSQTGSDVDSAACGNPDPRPRPLVSWIEKRSNGVPSRAQSFDYVNGRVRPGPFRERAVLGFSQITAATWIQDAGGAWVNLGNSVRRFRQERSFQGVIDSELATGADNAVLSQTTTSYLVHAPPPAPGVTAIARTREVACSHERTGTSTTALPCRRRSYTYDAAHLSLVQVRDGTDDPFLPNERDVVTDLWYAFDPAAWTIFNTASRTTRANLAGANLVLDMNRTTYDTGSGRTHRVLKRERLLFADSESATCGSPCNPWGAAPPPASWVTLVSTTSASYDARGNLLWSESTPMAGTPRGVTRTYDPYYLGLVATQTNALGHTLRFSYDGGARLLTRTDANSQSWITTRDVYGRATGQSKPDAIGSVVSQVFYGLTASGYLVQSFANSSFMTRHQVDHYLDGFGEERTTVDYSGTDFGTIWTDRSTALVGGRFARRVSLPHGAAGATRHIQTTFDERGRPVRVERVLAGSFAVEKTLSAFTYGVDAQRNRTVTRTDAGGKSTVTTYDWRGTLVKQTDALGNSVRFDYTPGMWLRQVTLPPSVDRLDSRLLYTYDSWGRQTSANDPTAGFRTFSWDVAGNLLNEKTFGAPDMAMKVREVVHAYDELDRLKGETAGGIFSWVEYDYDEPGHSNGIGRLTTITDTSGTTSYQYFPSGNVSSAVYSAGAGGPTMYTYQYDYQNRVKSMTFPDATQTFNYTSDGVLTQVWHGDPWHPSILYGQWQGFDARKRARTRRTYVDQASAANTTQLEFDVDDALSSMVVLDRTGAVVQSFAYGHDAAGNLTSIVDNRPSKTFDLGRTYAYDALDRLCAVGSTTCGSAPMYTYDALGNLINDNGTTNFYSMSLDGRNLFIQNRRYVNNAWVTNWTANHDAAGRRTRFDDCSVAPCVPHVYAYDYKNRLSSVSTGGRTETYQYDHAGRRTRKVTVLPTLRSTTTWNIGPAYELRQSSQNPSTYARTASIGGLATWTYGDVIDGQPASVLTGTTDGGVPQGIYLRHADHLGSPALLTATSSGAAVARQTFDAWGAPVAAMSFGTNATTSKFTGQDRDDFTALQHHGARYYDPRSKRFTTPDDRIVGGVTQGYNRFAYVLGNPASLVDPTGHYTQCGTLCVGTPIEPEGGGGPTNPGGSGEGGHEIQEGPQLDPEKRAKLREQREKEVRETKAQLRARVVDDLSSRAVYALPRDAQPRLAPLSEWDSFWGLSNVEGFDASLDYHFPTIAPMYRSLMMAVTAITLLESLPARGGVAAVEGGAALLEAEGAAAATVLEREALRRGLSSGAGLRAASAAEKETLHMAARSNTAIAAEAETEIVKITSVMRAPNADPYRVLEEVIEATIKPEYWKLLFK